MWVLTGKFQLNFAGIITMYRFLTVNIVIAINTMSIDKKSNYIIDEE